MPAPDCPTATLDPADATGGVWDAVVVGAGPAGSMAALHLARAGARTLLVDRASFPRHKVCGCCVNLAAIDTLTRAGLGGLPNGLGGVELRRLDLRSGHARACIGLPGGVAVSRDAFDAALVAAAIHAGAAFLPGTRACLGSAIHGPRALTLRTATADYRARAAAVIAADGLGGRLLDDEPGMRPRIHARSRMGAGAVVEYAPASYSPGTVHMAIAPGGYVGLVRLEDGRLDIAAAFRPAFVRASGGPGAAAARVLATAGLDPIAGLETATWRGTPALTRRRRTLASRGVFAIGDAAQYVEPFTGEGIAWALASGEAVVPHALAHARSGPARDTWTGAHRRLLGTRRLTCAVVAMCLRRPRLVRLAVALLSAGPALARPLVGAVNRPQRASAAR